MSKIHFVGIGGIGVSALARYFLSQGASVSGSDLEETALAEELKRDGARIFFGHDGANVPPGTDTVIYSAAVKNGNPELKMARALKIKTLSYARALGKISKKYFTVAVSGSHGKSTTTALLALILIEAGFDPTVIIGTKLREFRSLSSVQSKSGSNFRKGGSNYLVIEADEWNRSFHNYYPKIAVVTNIDKEHLDTYKNFRGVAAGFSRYLKNISRDGAAVLNWQDKALRKIGRQIAHQRRVRVFYFNKSKFRRHPLKISGFHNQLNAEAAWQAAKLLGVKKSAADRAFRNYQGAWRRLEFLGNLRGDLRIVSGDEVSIQDSGFRIPAYTDYAHHPTEVRATLAAMREKYPRRRLICVFEPHQQDRFARLFNDFIHAFDEADQLILLPVYQVSGRERKEKDKSADSFLLAQKINEHKARTFFARDFEAALKVIKSGLDKNSVIVFMSAGELDSKVREMMV